MADITLDQVIDYLISHVDTQKGELTEQQKVEEHTKEAPMDPEKDDTQTAPPPSPQNGFIINFQEVKPAATNAGKENEQGQNIFIIGLEVTVKYKIDKQ